MNKKYSELAELFRSEKTDEEILDFLLNFHKNDIADMLAGMTEEERKEIEAQRKKRCRKWNKKEIAPYVCGHKSEMRYKKIKSKK